ncbi:MAG: MASE3 domain-containing protein [Bacillota bacterium]|nr:MASE3 domain-containing protein [Bacillota bacterium]
MKGLTRCERLVFIFVVIAFIMAVAITIFDKELDNIVYSPKNSIGLHLILEFISISISFSIFTYGLRAFVNSQSKQLVYLSILFLVLGSIDFLHALSFEGMPVLFGESSTNKAAWYWIIARLTGGIFLIPTMILSDEKISKRARNLLLFVGILYVSVIAFVITLLDKSLPTLILNQGGSTSLQKQLEIIVISLQIIVIISGVVQYRNKKKEIYLYVSLAIFYLLFSEYMLGIYNSLLDVFYWAGHFYKVIAYTFILRGIYFYFIDEVALKEQNLINARKELDQVIQEQHGLIFKIIKSNKGFIHTLCNGDLLNQLDLPLEVHNKSIFALFPESEEKLTNYYHLVWNSEKKVTFEINEKNLNLYFTLKPVFINGKISEIIGTAVDLTRLKEMEAQIRENEKLGVLGELAAGIAHEVRNPLTTLKGFLQLIKADRNLYDLSFIELMLTEVDRIEMITDEFMSVARPHAHLFKSEDIVEILQFVVKFMQPQALLKGVDIQLKSSETLPTLVCEKNQLKQVFINLIKNAIEAMPKGGNIYIELKKKSHGFVEIIFRDEGIGIPEDVVEKLGQPFFTLKDGGNGLGLMMCKKIIDAHNGLMEIKSKIGAGTTFIVSLPYENEAELPENKSNCLLQS